MLIGKADTVLVENARVLALDLASPVLEAIARPVAVANRTIADLKEFATLREENARLREENARLLAWQTAARRLENENERLRGCRQFPRRAGGLLHHRPHRRRQRQRLCARRAAQCRTQGRRGARARRW